MECDKNQRISSRLFCIAVIYGGLAGALAGVVFSSMHIVQAWLWQFAHQRWAIFPIVVFAGVCIAIWSDYITHHLVQIINRPFVVTILGSIAMACIFTLWPALRFAGEHELFEIGSHPTSYSAGILLIGALAKLGAVLLTLRSGWKGGVIFPLMLVSVMIGLSVAIALPGDFYGIASISAMGTMLTAVTRKPLVAFLWFFSLYLVLPMFHSL